MKLAIVRTASSVLSSETYNIQEIGLARALASQGHTCDVYLAGREPGVRDGAGFREIRLRARALPGGQGIFPGLPARLARERYDLIQVHDDTQLESVRIASWAHRRTIPVVLCQGMYADYKGTAKRLVQAAFDRTLLPILRRSTRAVSAKSQAAREYAVRKGFANVVVHPIGLDTSAFESAPDVDWRARLRIPAPTKLILYVGAPEPPRRPERIVAAAARVVARGRDVVLVLAGDGPSRARHEAAARAALGERVRWIARVAQAELPSLYRSASVFVLPTTFEIYGMAALESMYFGTPVIASRVGGLIDLVGETSAGALLESADPDQWAGRIETVLTRNEEERARARAACRARAEALTWSALAASRAAFYEQVVRS